MVIYVIIFVNYDMKAPGWDSVGGFSQLAELLIFWCVCLWPVVSVVISGVGSGVSTFFP